MREHKQRGGSSVSPPVRRLFSCLVLTSQNKRTTDDNENTLKEYFSQKEARENEPWRTAARRADFVQNQALREDQFGRKMAVRQLPSVECRKVLSTVTLGH